MRQAIVAILPLLLTACGVGMDPEKPNVRDIRVLKATEVTAAGRTPSRANSGGS